MQTVTETDKVYKFDELTEDQKQTVLEKQATCNVDVEWWDYDGLLDLSAAEMASRRMTADYMSMGGCMIVYNWKYIHFDTGRRHYIQFHDYEVTDEDIFRRFLRIPKNLWDNCDWSIDGGSSSGFYGDTSSRMQIEADYMDGRDFTERQQSIVDRAIDIMNDKIDEALEDLISTYDYLTSEEVIIETIKLNEWEFTAEGVIA